MTRAHLISLAAVALAAFSPVEVPIEALAEDVSRRELLRQPLPGTPERELTLVEVVYGPGRASPPHLHEYGVAAFVIAGAIASRLNDEDEAVFHAGEAWYEAPGTVHRVSRNASTTVSASLLAIYIAPPRATLAQPLR